MFINSELLDQISSDGADVVIVGAGPAGITLALKLAKQKRRVLLLEAGGFGFPTEIENDPYVGSTTGRPYPVTASRLRYFGGSSNHWGGWVRPLDEEDFEVNDGIPYSGWPINYDELSQYYKVAHDICEVKGDEYDANKIDEIKKFNLLKFGANADFRNAIFRFSPPTRFGERYRQDIKTSPYIYCSLNTQLLRIERSSAGRTTLICIDSKKKVLKINAGQCVLAMGGIENARFLLYSSLMGDANFGGDWVGRCFVDHFALTTSLVLARPEINYDRAATSSGDVMARIAPSRKMLRQQGVGNLMIDIYPSDGDPTIGAKYLGNPWLYKNIERGWHYTSSGHGPSPE